LHTRRPSRLADEIEIPCGPRPPLSGSGTGPKSPGSSTGWNQSGPAWCRWPTGGPRARSNLVPSPPWPAIPASPARNNRSISGQSFPLGRRPYDLRHASVSLWLNSACPRPRSPAAPGTVSQSCLGRRGGPPRDLPAAGRARRAWRDRLREGPWCGHDMATGGPRSAAIMWCWHPSHRGCRAAGECGHVRLPARQRCWREGVCPRVTCSVCSEPGRSASPGRHQRDMFSEPRTLSRRSLPVASLPGAAVKTMMRRSAPCTDSTSQSSSSSPRVG
jgi:hypothetical protein